MSLESFLKDHASEALLAVFAAARARAMARGQRTHLAHIVDQLLDDPTVRGRLTDSTLTRAHDALGAQIAALPAGAPEAGGLAFDLSALVDPALTAAKAFSSTAVTPLLFLAACVSNDILLDPASEQTRESLRAAGFSADIFLPFAPESARRRDFTFQSLGLGTDLTAKARAGIWPTCPLIGMDHELESLVIVLNSMRYSAAIVGEPGVGKSALVSGLAWHIAHRTRPLMPADMDTWTIVRIEASDILTGTSGRGELESRLKEVLNYFIANPTVIPFFEEVHKLLDTDDPSSRAVATALKVPMAEERFRCIGVTTDREYARFIASDEAMNSRFRKILVPEPTEEQACQIAEQSFAQILRGKAEALGARFGDDAARTAVRITSTYQRNDRLPRKAINLLGEAAAETAYRLSLPNAGRDEAARTISGDKIHSLFSRVMNIPIDDLKQDHRAYYRRLEGALNERVRGQPAAVTSVTNHLALYASGLVDRRRPRGRFLFLGPPGVGKTELANVIAEEVLRQRGSLITVNMAEYAKEDALGKFMGASPGYVGFNQTPTIYSRVMMRPYSVIVLDEIEKAAPELANPLISILDGRADDSQGRAIDFAQCIFVMTSNALTLRDVAAIRLIGQLQSGAAPGRHARALEQAGIGAGTPAATVAGFVKALPEEQIAELVEELGGVDEENLRAHLASQGGVWTQPIVDRIDRIVIFNALSANAIESILDRMIEDRRRVASTALPPSLDDPAERQRIIGWATGGDAHQSARRLERGLLRWLSEAALGAGADT